MLITPHVIRSREEARYVSEDFKSKLSAARNEVERYRLEQEKLQQQRQLPPALIPQSTVPGPGASNRSMLPHRSSAPLKKPADQSAATLAIQDAAKAKRAQPSAAAVTELTNRNTPPPQPASPFQAPAEPGQAAQPMQLARQPEHPKSIPSALSVQLSEPKTQIQQPAASQPVSGNSIRPENSAGASVQGAAGREPAPKAKPVWMVQVASLPQEKEADNMAGLLRQQGYDVFVLTAEVDSKLRYRVRVGQLGTEREAVELQNALKAGNNFADSFVTRTMARQIAP
jgi:cell division septation protein DedD